MPIEVILNKKDKLKQVAENLFRKQGYHATSIRQIATALGIEKATVYSHVSSKEDLLRQICFEMAAEFFVEAELVENSNISADLKLRAAILGHIKVIANNIDAAAVFFHDWRHLSEPHLSEFKILRLKYEDYFKEIIKEGIEQHLFLENDAKFTVLTILSALNWTYEWYNPEGKMTYEEIGNNLADTLINGLKNK